MKTKSDKIHLILSRKEAITNMIGCLSIKCNQPEVFLGTTFDKGVIIEPWCTAQLHSIKPGLRFFASSNAAHRVSENCNGENL